MRHFFNHGRLKTIWVGFGFLLMILLSAGGLIGCKSANGEDKLDVVCTIFPQYDWIKTITNGNKNINLSILQDSGIDLHNYQPSAADKVKILGCDLLVYIGGESDQWVEEILSDSARNHAMKVMKLLEEIEALDEEEVPGGENKEHDSEHEKKEGEKDEHVWLSLKNAQTLCKSIAKTLQEIDPECSELYEENLRNYLAELNKLEAEYSQTVKSAARNVLLFGDRFPFRYLCEDYSLQYYAAFSGCSAESEASFEVVKSLAEAVDRHNLPYILVLETSDRAIAEQIKNSTAEKDQTILVMNSIQSVTKKQIEEGAGYLTLMNENLNVLKTALN